MTVDRFLNVVLITGVILSVVFAAYLFFTEQSNAEPDPRWPCVDPPAPTVRAYGSVSGATARIRATVQTPSLADHYVGIDFSWNDGSRSRTIAAPNSYSVATYTYTATAHAISERGGNICEGPSDSASVTITFHPCGPSNYPCPPPPTNTPEPTRPPPTPTPVCEHGGDWPHCEGPLDPTNTPAPDDAPAPSGVSATATSCSSISVSWNSVSEAAEYKASLDARPVTTSGTSASWSRLSDNVTYIVRVSARGDGTTYSTSWGASGSGSAKTPVCPVTPTPTPRPTQGSNPNPDPDPAPTNTPIPDPTPTPLSGGCSRSVAKAPQCGPIHIGRPTLGVDIRVGSKSISDYSLGWSVLERNTQEVGGGTKDVYLKVTGVPSDLYRYEFKVDLNSAQTGLYIDSGGTLCSSNPSKDSTDFASLNASGEYHFNVVRCGLGDYSNATITVQVRRDSGRPPVGWETWQAGSVRVNQAPHDEDGRMTYITFLSNFYDNSAQTATGPENPQRTVMTFALSDAFSQYNKRHPGTFRYLSGTGDVPIWASDGGQCQYKLACVKQTFSSPRYHLYSQNMFIHYPPSGVAGKEWTDEYYVAKNEPDKYFLPFVAMHEIGHLTGLGHTPDQVSVMSAYDRDWIMSLWPSTPDIPAEDVHGLSAVLQSHRH